MPIRTAASWVAVALIGASAPALALETGRSVAIDPSLIFQDCRLRDQVCGLLPSGASEDFGDRCEARKAGAKHILFGPCDDED